MPKPWHLERPRGSSAITAEQIAATVSPATPIREQFRDLAPEAGRKAGRNSEAGALREGNFADLDMLLEQFSSPPVFELGNPLPSDRHLPRRRQSRIARCPAAHNRALIDQASE